jgi:DNA-binding response OmpR family regulator
MSRVLIIEDNLSLAQGLRENLEVEGHLVTVAPDGAAGLDALAPPPDLVILDLMLPDQNGFRVLRSLRERDRRVPVLILTAREAEDDKVRGLRLGADDYVTKPFSLLELLARVDALLRRAAADGREVAVPAEEIRFADIVIYPGTRTVVRGGALVPLRPKELDLLLALIHRDGRVASRAELLSEVWGYSNDVSSRTVDTHIAELRRKLELDAAAPRHLLTVRKAGYRFDASGGGHSDDSLTSP